ncbi:MAG: GDSL-type esterase/lipase family protein, partial [Verrucomicrobiota bacterium]|nr:GDSL-type esterase/lipase family protein [Verrucomicrobiota bacterium]
NIGFGEKPFIISEIGAGAIYGSRDQLNGYWSEEYQAELLRLVCNEVTSNSKIAGVSLWQFCDIRTFQGPRAMTRPRCFNNKGTFDEYRRPKAAYITVKSIFQAFNTKAQSNEFAKISTSALKSDNGITIISTPVQRRDGVFDKGYLDSHNSHCKFMLKNNPSLVFIGDSITASWGDLLDEKFKKYTPANLGIGGDWVQNLHWRIVNGVFDQINPKVIVLLIGTNNLANGFSPEYVVDGTALCLKALLQKSPNSKIVLMGIFQRNKLGDDIRDKVDQVNMKTKLLANNKNIFYLNINDKLMDEDGLITSEIMPDGLHPAEPGYIIWADAITPIIEQLFKRSL